MSVIQCKIFTNLVLLCKQTGLRLLNFRVQLFLTMNTMRFKNNGAVYHRNIIQTETRKTTAKIIFINDDIFIPKLK